jgi:glucose uptake protein GlcU
MVREDALTWGVVSTCPCAGNDSESTSNPEENIMGYGLGAFLLAIGLILALAVQDSISGVDLEMVGWILTAVGLLSLLLTAVTANRARGVRTVETTADSDGRQVVSERRTSI